MNETNLLFKYDLTDAWGILITHIAVYDVEQPYARFFVKSGNRFLPPEEKTITLDSAAIAAIKKTLQRLHVTEIEPLTHVVVMDGYNQVFKYQNGVTLIEITASNISTCREAPKLYPNAMAMIRAQKRIAKTLTPYGIDNKCFALGLYW